MTPKKGRLWVIVLLIIIIVLPLITVYFLEKGMHVREDAQASERLIQSGFRQIPNYSSVSQTGDTITNHRMQNKVCVFDFVSSSCGKQIDAKERKLFELQEDYSGYKYFRILSFTLTPQQDSTHQLILMSERYSARQMWHYLRSDDSTATEVFNFCRNILPDYSVQETNMLCPQFVYLVDGEGNLRGCYDPLDTIQYNDLYNDMLFLMNKLNLDE